MRKESGKPRRRRIVEQSFEPGVSVTRLARAHHVNGNRIFRWRKLYREGLVANDVEKPAAQWLPVLLEGIDWRRPQRTTA